jgi:phosphoribosylformylglycinamidine synthase, clade II
MIFRLYVERRPGFDIEAKNMYREVKNNLLVAGIKSVRYINRYDTEGITEEILNSAKNTVFSEPQTDIILDSVNADDNDRILAIEYLPGQYDQRADSCSQCVQILTRGERPKIRTAKIYIFSGEISDAEFDKIKNYIINPVESREASLDMPATLTDNFDMPNAIEIIDGFISMTDDMIGDFISTYSLAMDNDDVKFCIAYFKNEEKRDPTLTELRMIDTYWSDHCRHTTFLTAVNNVEIHDSYIQETYNDYLMKRATVYNDRKKDISLMDLATIGAKYLKKTGQLKNLDESEEINACSVKIKVDVNGVDEDWLLMFKNETHNHPTEIEPFGGAATCLGGAIRDPLSGRSYVYQAMRVTGAADPRLPVSETMPGKLPQSKLTQGAANGYSSYGNQIGLATGGVFELYHPNYVAKRLEIGAVIGAAPESNVIREVPAPGDKIILLGGRTGRDGCGGATGSSKSHTADSLATCGAEVQKGNPPEERKIQRLFRNPDVTKLIKRCNDFGAGGVSVAIGELADGLIINLDKVPKKYEGLDGTELAVSESQERMAVVVKASDTDIFIKYAETENLEATVVAEVTEEPRLRMNWNGQQTVDLSREFLNSNGAPKSTDIVVDAVSDKTDLFNGISQTIDKTDVKTAFKSMISDLNVCSQKGLVERFDSSIGAATVVMPYGGKNQLTPTQYMAAKIPVTDGETTTASLMAYGFNPYLSTMSPYHGAMYAVIESIAKVVASGTLYSKCYLTFQEYFERTKNEPSRWGKPFAALLGAFKAQISLGIGSIGGKDSMSGTFENLDVPPTLVSFAVAASDTNKIITPEFKSAGHSVYFIEPKRDNNMLPDFDDLKKVFDYIHQLAETGKAKAIYTVGFGGIAEAIVKMSFGNSIGFKFLNQESDISRLFDNRYGAFIVEVEGTPTIDGTLIGHTINDSSIAIGTVTIPLDELVTDWETPLEKVFKTKTSDYSGVTVEKFKYNERSSRIHSLNIGKPRVVIPVFPGTNCEYDTKASFEKSGAVADIFVLNNLTPSSLAESLDNLAKLISKSQIFMLPGGFSGGDEPDGSGKFITAVLRNPQIKAAIMELIDNRDGLVLGICNGFQALVKSGLLPYGKILDEMSPDAPTLTYNEIGRHKSMMVNTRVASVNSPWFSNVSVGDIHTIPISHGEGRFIVSDELLKELAANGQIAAQYVDLDGNPTMDIRYNPNGSYYAIEGIFSPDGRIFGKMGHTERITKNLALNITGNKEQPIFKAGVNYFI